MTCAVSVVVATYNYGRFIAEALESIRGQTFNDFEVIIIDDGSTDDTASVVEPFLSDRRFRYFQRPHSGQPQAKNAGIREANAPLIAFLDADDRWITTKLARQVPFMVSNSHAGVSYTARARIDESGCLIDNVSQPIHRGLVTNELFRDNFICFSSAMVRRKVFDRVGLFDESIPLAIDYDMWLRASRRFEFDGIEQPLVEYRMGHANLSRRVGERLQIALRIMDRFRLEDHPPLLEPANIRAAYGDTYRNLGLVNRNEPGRGMMHFLRSLQWNPTDLRTWRAMAGSAVPSVVRQHYRRLLGIADWERLARPTLSGF